MLDANATLVLDDSPDVEITFDLDDSTPKPRRAVKKKPTKKPNLINDPVIAICIDEQFPYCVTAADLYTSTRGLWHLGQERAEHAKYAFAVYEGEIKEVYEIERWLPATKVFSDFWIARLARQGRTIHADEHTGTYEFIGHPAPEDIRKKYVGHKLPKRHHGNPIMYFNC
ncbi:MAG: hypothetical protein DMF69_06605 [Acidobacteria bacterium]|nr:MAG: hypothetical protein DMF69_06605 [Acidobacteriota bacterium]